MAEKGVQADAVYLAEYGHLREEIDNRTTLAGQIVVGQIVGLGAGLAVFEKVPDVLLGLAAASTLLWLYWFDHVLQIFKIAHYISVNLARALQEEYRGAPSILGWEFHVRKSRPDGGPGGIQVPIAALLLWATTPVLLTLHFVVLIYPSMALFLQYIGGPQPSLHVDVSAILRIAGALGVLGIWSYALHKHCLYTSWLRDIDRDIARAANRSTVSSGKHSAPATRGRDG